MDSAGIKKRIVPLAKISQAIHFSQSGLGCALYRRSFQLRSIAGRKMPSSSTTNEADEARSGSTVRMTYLRVSNSSSGEDLRTHDQEGEEEEEALLEDDLTSSLVPQTPSQVQARRSLRNSCKTQFRRVGNLLGYITLATMAVLIPVVIYKAASNRRADVAAFRSAEVMVLGTFVLSLRLIYLHLTHWYMPDVQKYVVRILWMVPLYSVQSWLSLRYRDARLYIDTVRDIYEAYVIASFLYYLIELLGGQDALVQILRRKNDPHLGKHSFPVNLFVKPWQLGMEFMLQCKHGVLQYVVVRVVLTVLTLVLQGLGLYGEGEFKWNETYPYISFFMNISVMYALYCLVKLFHAVNHELCYPVNWRPLGKFLCVKGVVFFTWWQGVVIFYLQAHGVIGAVGTWKADEIANGLIDYCICVEMVFFAIAHSYTFTHKEYLPGNTALEEQHQQQQQAAGEGGEYRPPAIRTLTRPMRFQDAFWSSTVPEETLNDIQRLRQGVDGAVSQAMDPGEVTLREIHRSPRDEYEDEEVVFEDPNSDAV